MNQQQLNKIDEEFNEIFNEYLTGCYCCSGRDCACNGITVGGMVKDFLHSKLQEAIKDERERIIEIVQYNYDYLQALNDAGSWATERDCLTEIINKIKSL
jgi:hypothetical protein